MYYKIKIKGLKMKKRMRKLTLKTNYINIKEIEKEFENDKIETLSKLKQFYFELDDFIKEVQEVNETRKFLYTFENKVNPKKYLDEKGWEYFDRKSEIKNNLFNINLYLIFEVYKASNRHFYTYRILKINNEETDLRKVKTLQKDVYNIANWLLLKLINKNKYLDIEDLEKIFLNDDIVEFKTNLYNRLSNPALFKI